MEVPDQGHSLRLLEDPSKCAFVTVDGKPVPVFLTHEDVVVRQEERERRVMGSIKGVLGQRFEVGFWDGRRKGGKYGREVSLWFGDQCLGAFYASAKEICTTEPNNDAERFAMWHKRSGRPFEFAKLPTTDNSAVACTNVKDLDKYSSIEVHYNDIKRIRVVKKTGKGKKSSQATAKQDDPLRKQAANWRRVRPVDERTDKGQFGLAASFGARRDDRSSSEPVTQSDSDVSEYGEGGYEAAYDYVRDSRIKFIFFIRSAAWIDKLLDVEPSQKASMPKGARIDDDGTIYLDEADDDADEKIVNDRPSKRLKSSHDDGADRSSAHVEGNRDESDVAFFSETDDDRDDKDLSPQQLARTLYQDSEIDATVKVRDTIPSPNPAPTATPSIGQSSSITITMRRSAYGRQEELEMEHNGPVAGGSGVGAAGATQVGEEWRGGV